MSNFEKCTLVLQVVGIICSIGAIIYTVENLREIRKQFFEQNRGMLVFYINKMNYEYDWMIVKNYVNCPAELIYLKITPELDWEKSDIPNIEQMKESIISNAKNVFLAPKQHIKSMFDFRKYDDTELNVEIKYKTCGKVFIEKYKIDLKYKDYIVSLKHDPKEKIGYLEYIHEEIKGLNDKFL